MSKDQRNWRRVTDLMPGMRVYQKEVDDGHLSVIAGPEPDGFHLSISHRTNTHPPKPGRYPTWDEICEARDRMMVQLLPPRDQWVNVHSTTFHLWEQLPCEHNGGAS